jgi:hypothetical protein
MKERRNERKEEKVRVFLKRLALAQPKEDHQRFDWL